MYIKDSEYLSKFTGAEIDDAIQNSLEVEEKLELKVDKTQKVNGKALEGDITLTATDVGAQPTITASNMLSSDLVTDVGKTHKFVTADQITQLGTNTTNIDTINSKIPSEASSSNKLADKNYVSTLVATNTTSINTINSKIPSEATSTNKLADKNYVSNLIGNGTITITQGGVSKGTFSVNQKGNATIALESGGGSGGASSMADLSDVALDNLENGQTLIYNSEEQKWENSNSSGSSISTLGDVELTDLSNGQTLVYNSDIDKWENSNSSGGAVSTLSDVTLSDVEDGQTLVYDSSEQKWVNGNTTSVTFVDWTS